MTTRLEALLGAPIVELTEPAIRALVTTAAREDTDLEFKGELYGNSDAEKKDLAADVAAMANALGGVILLGVQEDDAVAVSVEPVELSDGEEQRIQQIVAANCFPFPEFALHRVPSDDDETSGWYVIEVQRSPFAPHCVRADRNLRYPQRSKTTTRWLSESEVADAYRNRFSTAAEQTDRLDQLMSDIEVTAKSGGTASYLVTALVPNRSGHAPIDVDALRNAAGVVSMAAFPRFFETTFDHALSTAPRVGHRHIAVGFGGKPSEPVARRGAIVHLYTDGSSAIVQWIGDEARSPTNDPVGYDRIPDARLTQELIAALAVLGQFATGTARTTGDAVVASTIFSRRGARLATGGQSSFNDDYTNDAPLQTIAQSRHTLSLDDLVGGGPSLLAAAAQVGLDLFQSFGCIECPQLTADGEVRRRHWHTAEHQIESAARPFGIDVTDEAVWLR